MVECERVFSPCGQLVERLRNQMQRDNLASVVYISKNLDQEATLQEILEGAWDSSGAIQFKSDLANTSVLSECELAAGQHCATVEENETTPAADDANNDFVYNSDDENADDFRMDSR
eukprot:scaffold383383_cov31-Prasinocladus_malaysianus.AAC.1